MCRNGCTVSPFSLCRLTANFDPTKTPEREVAAWFKEFVNENRPPKDTGGAPAVSNKEREDAVTGILLLINNNALAHLLEAPMKVIQRLLFTLADKQNKGTSILIKPKICALTEEVPREYPVWTFRSVKATTDDFTGSSHMVKVRVHECTKDFCMSREDGVGDAKNWSFLLTHPSLLSLALRSGRV